MCRATWYSSRIPLPPRMSRASAHTRRAAAAVFSLASEAAGLALLLQATQAVAEHLHPDHVGQHAGQLVLNQLEAGDGPPELGAPPGVGQGALVGGDGASERLPGDAPAGHVSTRAVSAKERANCRRCSTGARTSLRVISACHMARLAVFPPMTQNSYPSTSPGAVDDKPADGSVLVTGPDDDVVGHRTEPDPPLDSVEDPVVTREASRGLQARDIGSVVRLGEAKAPRRSQLAIFGSHPSSCSSEPSRAMVHGQSVVDGPERGQAAVGPASSIATKPLDTGMMSTSSRRGWSGNRA